MQHPRQQQITELLGAIESGNRAAVDELIPFVYEDLRQLAGRIQREQGNRHTLQPTALVHEAYVRILGNGGSLRDHQHFLAVAALAMRQLLADYAKRRRSLKRGGDLERVELEDAVVEVDDIDGLDLLALDEALTDLAAIDARQARIVELRFFTGMSVEETAAVVGISARTVKLDWQMARAWLVRRLQGGDA